jgi:hypothetical protein
VIACGGLFVHGVTWWCVYAASARAHNGRKCLLYCGSADVFSRRLNVASNRANGDTRMYRLANVPGTAA